MSKQTKIGLVAAALLGLTGLGCESPAEDRAEQAAEQQARERGAGPIEEEWQEEGAAERAEADLEGDDDFGEGLGEAEEPADPYAQNQPQGEGQPQQDPYAQADPTAQPQPAAQPDPYAQNQPVGQPSGQVGQPSQPQQFGDRPSGEATGSLVTIVSQENVAQTERRIRQALRENDIEVLTTARYTERMRDQATREAERTQGAAEDQPSEQAEQERQAQMDPQRAQPAGAVEDESMQAAEGAEELGDVRLIVFRVADAEARELDSEGIASLLEAPRQLAIYERGDQVEVAFAMVTQPAQTPEGEPIDIETIVRDSVSATERSGATQAQQGAQGQPGARGQQGAQGQQDQQGQQGQRGQSGMQQRQGAGTTGTEGAGTRTEMEPGSTERDFEQGEPGMPIQ